MLRVVLGLLLQKNARSGTTLVLHTRSNHQALELTVEHCRNLGAKVSTFQGNLTDASVTKKLVETTLKILPEINGVVSNAGFPDWRDFETLPIDGFMNSIHIMQQTNFILMSAFSDALIQTQGSYIGISSFLAHKMKVDDNINPTSASEKAGLEDLLRSFASQYASKRVRCNAIVPGYIKKDGIDHIPPSNEVLTKITSRIPAGRLGLPQEAGELTEFC